MGPNSNIHQVQFNFLDADTMQTIRNDFSTQVSYSDQGRHTSYKTVMGGSGTLEIGAYNDHFILNEAQIEAMGYDFKSVKGNKVAVRTDDVTGIQFLPSTVHITIKKKK